MSLHKSSFYNRWVIFVLLLVLPSFCSAVLPTPTPNCCQGVTLLTGFYFPGLITVDYANQLLYVPEWGPGRVVVLDSNTFAPVTVLSNSLNQANGVAVDQDGNLYVADQGTGHVEKFGSSGTGWIHLASVGTGLSARGVWVEGGGNATTIYATSNNNVIYQFNSTGLSTYPASPNVTYSTNLYTPTGIVKKGNLIYVTDSLHNQVVSFDTTAPASPPVTWMTGLNNPAGICLDLAQHFYVGESNANLIHDCGTNFSINKTCSVPSQPWGVAVNASGNVFVSEISLSVNAVTVLQGCVLEPTLTPTATTTPQTSTWTPTCTSSSTPSSTGTPSATSTPTASATSSPTQTLTNTGTCTPSSTSSATASATPTATNSFTQTPSATFTDSWTPTFSPTVTRTSTWTPTATSSPTPTWTPTWTLTWTMTSTPTPTLTSTWTSTFTCTGTPTPTPTVTYSSTPSFTFTPTFTRTSTFTSTWTPTFTSTGTPTWTSTATFTFTWTPTWTPTFSPTWSFTPTWTLTSTNSFTPTRTFKPTLSPTRTYSPTLTLTWTWTSTSTKTWTPTVTPSWTFTLTPTVTPTPTWSFTPTQTGTPTATFRPGEEDFFISKNLFHPDQGPVSIMVGTTEFPGRVQLRVYNSAGEQIRTLEDRSINGPFRASYLWDGTNLYGDTCASGVYVVFLQFPFRFRVARVLLVH